METPLIIAELGINHQGDPARARDLVYAAHSSGCGGVKFQYRNLERAYMGRGTEIGDGILQTELGKTSLAADEVLTEARVARDLGIQVGVSLFTLEDLDDFGSEIELFDFFKSPSVELSNVDLLAGLLSLGKHLYVSLGAHSEVEIENALGSLTGENWTPLHCVSNYPTNLNNSKLGYITFLLDKWSRKVGYSSHDVNWEACLLAMQLGATTIERHITLDKTMSGLDHSSSSTPDEFSKLTEFASTLGAALSGNGPKVPNQGELLNLQNLGRSYFAVDNLKSGSRVSLDELVYRSPKVGLDRQSLSAYFDRPLNEDVQAGKPLTKSSFDGPIMLTEHDLTAARNMGLSLPVRLHDYEEISKKIPIGAFEFHLSYEEVARGLRVTDFTPTDKLSVHLPDYVDSTRLFDPFSDDSEIRESSTEILESCSKFVSSLQQMTGHSVPLVGSFSRISTSKEVFYSRCGELVQQYSEQGVPLAMQWLPPFAWYFGGSEAIEVFCGLEDLEFIKMNEIPICLDVSHLGLGRNFFHFDAQHIMLELGPLVMHAHIADTQGIDGEGLQIGDGDSEDLILKALDLKVLKVIEVWQGHLDGYRGFIEGIRRLTRMVR